MRYSQEKNRHSKLYDHHGNPVIAGVSHPQPYSLSLTQLLGIEISFFGRSVGKHLVYGFLTLC